MDIKAYMRNTNSGGKLAMGRNFLLALPCFRVVDKSLKTPSNAQQGMNEMT